MNGRGDPGFSPLFHLDRAFSLSSIASPSSLSSASHPPFHLLPLVTAPSVSSSSEILHTDSSIDSIALGSCWQSHLSTSSTKRHPLLWHSRLFVEPFHSQRPECTPALEAKSDSQSRTFGCWSRPSWSRPSPKSTTARSTISQQQRSPPHPPNPVTIRTNSIILLTTTSTMTLPSIIIPRPVTFPTCPPLIEHPIRRTHTTGMRTTAIPRHLRRTRRRLRRHTTQTTQPHACSRRPARLRTTTTGRR